MNTRTTIVVLTASLMAPLVHADSKQIFGLPVKEETDNILIERNVKHIPEWNLWLLTEERAIKNSGVFRYFLSLRRKNGSVAAQYESLLGPFHVSPTNNQIFACEENHLDFSEYAALLDLNGNIEKKINHQGFFRNCGLTADKKLYWLEYANSDDGKVPFSTILVVNRLGEIVHKSILKTASMVTFTHEGKVYKLPFSAPILPG